LRKFWKKENFEKNISNFEKKYSILRKKSILEKKVY
jgi:hypothetical protein